MNKKSWCPCAFVLACFFLALALTYIVLPQAVQAANLVQNPGFEQGLDYWGEYWRLIRSDVDADGMLSGRDTAVVARYAARLPTEMYSPLTPEEIEKAAEVSGEGEINGFDAGLIAKKAAGNIREFPVEE